MLMMMMIVMMNRSLLAQLFWAICGKPCVCVEE
jgi:hypothetical protein